MTNAMDRLLSADIAPGIYTLDMSVRASAVRRPVRQRGWAYAHINGSRIFDKTTLLEQTALALAFPTYFGHNWDALEECITEPSLFTEPGCVLLYDHAAVLFAQHPDVWNTYYDILASAIEFWRNQGHPLYVILRNIGNILQLVPAL